jgi:hypothetical protein
MACVQICKEGTKPQEYGHFEPGTVDCQDFVDEVMKEALAARARAAAGQPATGEKK